METAFSKKLIKDRSFASKDLSVSTVETDDVYLNEDEIEALRQLDLSDKSRLDNARDLFLIGCYTGLRYSDIRKLSMNQVSHKNGKTYLTVPTIKTNKNVVIPLKQAVLDIIEKYHGFPKGISNQKVNDYIKEFCKLAELNEQILVRKHIKSKVVPEYKPKWEMISSHTARRSFATNAYLNGIPSIKIMKITGHKKETTFLKYIRINELENAMDLADNDFFN